MDKEDIVKLAHANEGNAAKLKAALTAAIDSGEITESNAREAIGYGSEAYPIGFPGLYDIAPDWWASLSAERGKKIGGRGIAL